jgi:hypothetical protein
VPIIPVNSTKTHSETLPPPRVRVRSRPMPPPSPETCAEPTDIPPSNSEDDYAVGYGRPPKHTQFRPGQSGNPKGRPRRAKGLNSIVRDTLTQKVAVRTAHGQKKISCIEAVLQKTVEQAMKGNPRALAELLKLYANAVPDQKTDGEPLQSEEDLTATDLAMLEELRRMLSAGQELAQ